MSPVLALGITQIIGYGSLFYAFPILVPGISAEFGRPEAHLYGVFSAGLLAGGLVAPFAGRLIDRIGAPKVMAGGSLAAGLTLAGLGLAPGFWSWTLGILVIELVAVAVLYDAAFAGLALLRGSGARRAITRLTLIAGFASTVFWPLADWLSDREGWRATYAVFASLHLTAGLGLHLWLVRQSPAVEPVTVPLAGANSDAVPLPPAFVPGAFRAVAVSFALSGALIAVFGVHMVPILTKAGLGERATVAAMLVGPAQVAIRLVDAVFFARLHPLTVSCVSALALPIAAMALLTGLPLWLAGALFAGVFGVGQGLSSIVRGSVPLSLFGRAGYGARLGRLAMIRTFVSAGAPFGAAAVLSVLGLELTLWFCAALGVAGALPLLVLRSRLIAGGHLAPLR